MHIVMVELNIEPGKQKEFLDFYENTVVPFAKSKTKVKDIRVVPMHADKVSILRCYEHESDTRPLHGDETYKDIVDKAGRLFKTPPVRAVHPVHAMI